MNLCPNSQLYVAAYSMNIIHVFDTNCSLLQKISFKYTPYGLNSYKGYLYASSLGSDQVLMIQNGVVFNQFTISECTTRTMYAIVFDSFDNMAISCPSNSLVIVYDFIGSSQSVRLTVQETGLFNTKIDSSGRYVLMNGGFLDIYY